MTTSGAVMCWGGGRLHAPPSSLPVDIPELSANIATLAIGAYHGCALTLDGAVKCWGDNTPGSVGDGTTDYAAKPVGVIGLSDVAPATCPPPGLSTLEALPASVPADHATAATIRVTLCDDAGQPLVGKTVLLSSDRGEDLIAQPETPTDANGQTMGSVRSFLPGSAVIQAVDVTDYVQVQQSVTVEFTSVTVQPGAELATSIRALHTQTTGQLDLLSKSAQRAGQFGEMFRAKITEDTARRSLDLISGVADAGAVAVELDARLMTELALPGVSETGWGFIAQLKELKEGPKNLFNDTWRHALQEGNYRALVGPVLVSGLAFYSAEAIDAKLEDQTQGKIIDALGTIAASSSGLRAAAMDATAASADFQDGLATERDSLLRGVPQMTTAQQHAYALDLNARRGVAAALVSPYYRQALYLKNMLEARAALNAGEHEFWLKFGANALAEASFDGVGKFLVSTPLTSFDLYRDQKALDIDQQGHALALGILKGTIESARSIYTNAATGYERIRQQLPPQTVTGVIRGISHTSAGSNRLWWWVEERSYSEVTVTNTSDWVASFEVIAEYGYDTAAFGFPVAYTPVATRELVRVPAHGTATIRLPYKDGQYGGSPKVGDHVYFYVIAINSTGAFSIGYKDTLWYPTQRPATAAVSAASDTRDLAGLATDAPTIENPIATYVFRDPGTQTYQAQIWAHNPFSSTVTAAITQQLPPGIEVVSTDGTLAGATISWSKPIAASGVTSATLTFRSAAPPDTGLSLPPAALAVTDPETAQTLTVSSNPASFAALWPVAVKGYAPLGRTGVPAVMPVSVTNLAEQAVSGSVSVVLSRAQDVVVSSDTQLFTVAVGGIQDLSFDLPPGLSPGLYGMEVQLTVDGVTRTVIHDTYQVQGYQVFLPLARRSP